MSTLQLARDELAALATSSGWNPYSTLPGSATLPAVVVGLPERITELSATLQTVELPVYVLVRSASRKQGETDLLDRVEELAAVYRSTPSTTSIKALRVVDLDSFVSVTIGNVEAQAAVINLSLTITTP